MWNILFIILLFLSGSIFGNEDINVISYNIRLDHAGDGVDNWHNRKEAVVQYLMNQNVDFIGIQEGLSHQVSYLNQELSSYDYIGVGRDDGILAGEFMAIFYKKSKWKLLRDSTIWLSSTPQVPSMGWDAACNRTVTTGVFRNTNGNEVVICNTHLDHKGQEARRRSIEILKNLINVFEKDYPVVLIGDFNFSPDHELYTEISGYLNDAAEQDVGNKDLGTFNAFNLSGPFERRIDYIFYSSHYFNCVQYERQTPTSNNRQASDHFPVEASFQLLGEYVHSVFEHGSSKLKYRVLFPPNFDPSKKYPLILFLHGAGERGDQNKEQLMHGSKLFRDSIEKYPSVVIFPQCPKNNFWAKLDREYSSSTKRLIFETEGDPTSSLATVIALVEDYLKKDYIDQRRFYLTGISMGGMGVWELLWRIPDKIAAAMPICGGGPTPKGIEMINIPIWAFHGVQDKVVNPNLSIRMIQAVQQLGGMAKISLYPDVKHNSWEKAFEESNFLSWMFSKSKH